MAYELHIASAAEVDIQGACSWYEKKKEGLGDRFRQHLIAKVNELRENPLKFQVRYNQVRIAFLKRFPYGIHYFTSNDNILIIAVFHTSRNPANWKGR